MNPIVDFTNSNKQVATIQSIDFFDSNLRKIDFCTIQNLEDIRPSALAFDEDRNNILVSSLCKYSLEVSSPFSLFCLDVYGGTYAFNLSTKEKETICNSAFFTLEVCNERKIFFANNRTSSSVLVYSLENYQHLHTIEQGFNFSKTFAYGSQIISISPTLFRISPNWEHFLAGQWKEKKFNLEKSALTDVLVWKGRFLISVGGICIFS